MQNIEQLFINSGGWTAGHTSFRNGLHGNGWIEKGYIIKNPHNLDVVTQAQANLVAEKFPTAEILVGVGMGGSILASHVGKKLDTEFTILMTSGEEIIFHRMFVPEKGTKIVLIDDLVFTGTDLSKSILFLKEQEMEVLGAVVWISRQESIIHGVPIADLMKSPFELYKTRNCPLCAQNIPIKYEEIRE